MHVRPTKTTIHASKEYVRVELEIQETDISGQNEEGRSSTPFGSRGMESP